MANTEEIAQKLALYYTAVKAELTASENVMKALEDLKVTAGGSTFIHEGQHFQIRKRNDKTYLCELAGPPKGRPKKRATSSGGSDAAESTNDVIGESPAVVPAESSVESSVESSA